MNKNKLFIIILCLIVVVLVICCFLFPFLGEGKFVKERRKIEDIVISYLEDKYNEEFEVINFSSENNYYELENVEENANEIINDSYIYTVTVSSSRLIEFDVIYVVYEDEEEYIKNKDNNIREPGIYENYIYEYKIRDIKNEIKEEVYNIISNALELSVSMESLSLTYEDMLVDYSLYDENLKSLYKKYYELDKSISNIDFYNLSLEIDKYASLILDIKVNDFIDESNIDEFNDEIKKLVSYLQAYGYLNYNINFSFNSYESVSVSRYLENGFEQIYVMFDYSIYSDVLEDERFSAFIIDK